MIAARPSASSSTIARPSHGCAIRVDRAVRRSGTARKCVELVGQVRRDHGADLVASPLEIVGQQRAHERQRHRHELEAGRLDRRHGRHAASSHRASGVGRWRIAERDTFATHVSSRPRIPMAPYRPTPVTADPAARTAARLEGDPRDRQPAGDAPARHGRQVARITRAAVFPMTHLVGPDRRPARGRGGRGRPAARRSTGACSLLAVVGLVLAHAANNMINDYFDIDAAASTPTTTSARCTRRTRSCRAGSRSASSRPRSSSSTRSAP